MRYIFKFPDIGEGLDEGRIIEWHVEKGGRVKMGDPLCTMETDKVVTAIPSPKDGIIVAKFGKPGETIHVGSALVEIEIEADSSEKGAADSVKTEAVEEEGAGVVGTLEVAGNNIVLSASKEGVSATETGVSKKQAKVLATPVARAMAKEYGLEINNLKGSGPGGRITKEDIIKYTRESSRPAEEKETRVSVISDSLEPVEIEPLSQTRKSIARHMIESKRNAAHMTLFEEVEISELERIRLKYKEELLSGGVKLTYLPFVVKAVAASLAKFRSLNAEMDMEGERMIYKRYYNIGIATDTERGLVVPVIRHADKLTVTEIAAEIGASAEKARQGKLTFDDLKGGTFSITSYGNIGGLFAVPVINYPQAAILGVGRVSKKPVVKDDQIVPGIVMPLSLSVDHRIADGGETARFMNSVISYLSDPVKLLF
ncbi:MAG: dihydrolipoamide acetyltransferase family protein [Bacteroidales bacterium]|nr:dihydrolipoamide acetyltransferase family protein [Bacteroidales bacterium]MDD3988516.1 dihydrolipoamide acetyltransferase family protein [Bacteroidales bacterium]MDD4638203.1 dihydrolipoamide acetyltransferase family protein [Bacteroidales bacterium]